MDEESFSQRELFDILGRERWRQAALRKELESASAKRQFTPGNPYKRISRQEAGVMEMA